MRFCEAWSGVVAKRLPRARRGGFGRIPLRVEILAGPGGPALHFDQRGSEADTLLRFSPDRRSGAAPLERPLTALQLLVEILAGPGGPALRHRDGRLAERDVVEILAGPGGPALRWTSTTSSANRSVEILAGPGGPALRACSGERGLDQVEILAGSGGPALPAPSRSMVAMARLLRFSPDPEVRRCGQALLEVDLFVEQVEILAGPGGPALRARSLPGSAGRTR